MARAWSYGEMPADGMSGDETFEEDMAINREIEKSLLAVDRETGKDMKEEKDV